MDYSKLSDFEINKQVLAIKSGIKPLGYSHNADERSAGLVDVSGNYHWFDFCNNAADAWPIIQKSGISVVYDGDDWLALHFSRPSLTYPNDHRKHPDKPFRAALILWLMMQESER